MQNKIYRQKYANFGDVIKKARQEKGWSILELASSALLEYKTVWEYEHKKHIPNKKNFTILCQTLEIEEKEIDSI
jgi:ribosome-binding protein aMBF1 (putative translation factor)